MMSALGQKPRIRTNAECDGAMLEQIARPRRADALRETAAAEALSYRGETLRRAQVAA
ncbi:MAG TPA: hypothetical protein VIF65_05595 [Methyloceanibacter sp.]